MLFSCLCPSLPPQPEIKAFLETVHGLHVEKVSTINYQGKKKKEVDFQGKPHYYRCVFVCTCGVWRGGGRASMRGGGGGSSGGGGRQGEGGRGVPGGGGQG